MAVANDFSVGLMHELAIALAKIGAEPQDVVDLIRDPKRLQSVLLKEPKINADCFAFIVVNHNLSLAEMMAAGQYDWVNDDIARSRFLIVGKGEIRCETRLFHFGRFISSEDAVKSIEADGWEAAKIEHLLAFGVKCPEEQRKYLIIGLGSSCTIDGYRYVPYLGGGGGAKRHLNLYPWDGDWDGDYRFLAARTVL